MLAAVPDRPDRPPFGMWQPQGLVVPLTSVVLRMTRLSGWRTTPLGEVAAAAKAGSSRRVANATENRVCMRPPDRLGGPRRGATSTLRTGRRHPTYRAPRSSPEGRHLGDAMCHRGQVEGGEQVTSGPAGVNGP